MSTSEVIKLIEGDERPIIELELLDNASTTDPKTAIDLSDVGTVVYVYFRLKGETATLAKITCTLVTDGLDGKVKFDFTGGVLTGLAVGAYEGQIEIAFSTEIHTLPDILSFRLQDKFAAFP
jgi:hypothetical protein